MKRTLRTVLAAGVLLAAGVAAIASGDTDAESDNTGGGAGSTETSVSKGLGSADATADIVSYEIVPGDFFTEVSVTITNNSEKRSDYFVTIAAESPDGSVRHDDTTVIASNIEPGQTTTETSMFTKDLPADAVLKLLQVQRTASL